MPNPADYRTKRQKLEDLASHPRTPKNEAAAARRMLDKLGPAPGIRVEVNGEDVTDRVRWNEATPGPRAPGLDDLAEAIRKAQDAVDGKAPGGRYTAPPEPVYRSSGPYANASEDDLWELFHRIRTDAAARGFGSRPGPGFDPLTGHFTGYIYEQAKKQAEAESARRNSPNNCPGCKHRAELHSSGICFMCKRFSSPDCPWHFEESELDDDGNATYRADRMPGWYRNE